MGAVYQFKPGSHFNKLDAQRVGDRIEELRERANGLLTPEAVVNDARSEKSPLHDAFEWDDSTAANHYRIYQARILIACVVAVQEEAPEKPPLRAFVNVRQREDRGYTSLAVAMSDAELRAQVVDKAWRELLGWRERYREYKELAAVFTAIDAAADDRAA